MKLEINNQKANWKIYKYVETPKHPMNQKINEREIKKQTNKLGHK